MGSSVFVIPLFPEASQFFAPWIMLLGAIGILYGGKLAYAQTDLKRLVAYTSVSHMGFVLLGAFAFNELAWQGSGDADDHTWYQYRCIIHDRRFFIRKYCIRVSWERWVVYGLQYPGWA